MGEGGCVVSFVNGYCFYGVCLTLRSDVLLGGYGNYEYGYCNSVRG